MFDGAPILVIELLLPIVRQRQEHEIAYEVNRGEGLALGIHRLEDELRIVFVGVELRVDDHQFVQAVPQRFGGGLPFADSFREECFGIHKKTDRVLRQGAAVDQGMHGCLIVHRQDKLVP